MEETNRNSYRSITKAIGLFGGTKVFQIIVGLIKNKLVAMLLGPLGMGISSMITSTTSVVSAFTSMGLSTSGVRDVAQSYNSKDQGKIDRTVTILQRLVWLTGIIGTLIVFAFAQQLSILSFKNEEWTWGFRIVSITLLINQLVIGQNVLLQGTFHYRYIALAALYSSVAGLIINVPMYFIWRFDAIVPAIVVTSAINIIITSYYSRKVTYHSQNLSWKEIWDGGKPMLILGLALTLTSGVHMLGPYIVRYFLTSIGTLETVGIYAAGIVIANEYINLILNSMGTDYTPRLMAAYEDRPLFIDTINRQAVLLVTLVAPLIIVFVVLAKELTLVLYTDKFLPMVGMIEWMMFGMFFRALSWSMSFAVVASGKGKMYFFNELLSATYSISLTIFGYKWFGYIGIGVGFCITYILYTIQMYVICHNKFGFHFNREIWHKVFTMIVLSFVMVLVLNLNQEGWQHYVLGVLFTIAICILSYRWLDQMIGIKSVMAGFKNKFYTKK